MTFNKTITTKARYAGSDCKKSEVQEYYKRQSRLEILNQSLNSVSIIGNNINIIEISVESKIIGSSDWILLIAIIGSIVGGLIIIFACVYCITIKKYHNACKYYTWRYTTDIAWLEKNSSDKK